MKRRNLAALFCGVTLLAVSAGCAARGGVPRDLAMQSVGAIQVGAFTTPNPPTTGENVLTVVLRDAQGKPVRGGAVETIASMPAMGAMPYMESRGVFREQAPGVYQTRIGLAMAGDWDLRVKTQPRGGEPVESHWRVSTNAKGVSFVEGAAVGNGARAGSGAAAGDGARADAGAGATGAGSATAGSADSGDANASPQVITIDARRRQSLGIKLDAVTERELTVEIRAAGRVAYDETRRVDVSARFAGFVRAIHADFTGQAVRRGEPLFDIYSPELWSAQQEYLQALTAAREDSLRGSESGGELATAARTRLRLWDVSASDLDAIARTGKPREAMPVRAPVSGVVTEKNVTLGSPVSAGQIVYRIAPTDEVWVLANVYEQDLPWVRLGNDVTLSLPNGAGAARHGKVSFMAPELAADTRTGTIRIAAANHDGALKPGMYIDALMHVRLGRRLAIPESAVLPTGERRVVFVDMGDGRLEPRDVTLGARAGEWVEVRAGLAAGDRVVTAGNFLVAAESKLRSATGKW